MESMKDLLDIQIIPHEMMGGSSCSLENLPLAYAYVPYQKYEKPYDKETALKAGTIFPSLNKPLGVYGKEFGESAGAKL